MTTEPSPELSFKDMRTQTPTSSTSSLMADRADRPKTVYFHGGIGGAGNYHHVAQPVSDVDSATSTHSRPHQPRRPFFNRAFRKNFSSGIGGAGNMHSRGEEAALTEIEEEARARARETHAPKQWHVGIGGAGNKRARRQDSPCSDFSGSTGSGAKYSTEPLPLGAAETLRRKILGERWSGR